VRGAANYFQLVLFKLAGEWLSERARGEILIIRNAIWPVGGRNSPVATLGLISRTWPVVCFGLMCVRASAGNF
jgi:hypothetical protein